MSAISLLYSFFDDLIIGLISKYICSFLKSLGFVDIIINAHLIIIALSLVLNQKIIS